MPDVNYKQKYAELKQKYMKSVDTAFRLGYEQGQNDAQVQQVQQQQAEQAAMAQAQAAGQAGGQSGDPSQGQEAAPGGEQPDSAHPQGSELDQHIAQLEGMLGKSELSGEDLKALQKSIGDIKKIQENNKAQAAIKGIAKALNKSLPKLVAPKHAGVENMTSVAKNALSTQEKIVQDLFKAWDEQEKNAGKSIQDILSGEGLTQKA